MFYTNRFARRASLAAQKERKNNVPPSVVDTQSHCEICYKVTSSWDLSNGCCLRCKFKKL